MASDLNTRLAAILERHPQLRPTDTRMALYLHHRDLWCWGTTEKTYNPEGHEDDLAAHALIFKSMVENLPCCYLKEDSIACWHVRNSPEEPIAFGKTALDAICAYYEGADHAG